MRRVFLGILLILTCKMFAAECFYGEDWVTLKKICSECSGIDPNTMTDTEAVSTIRNDLLPYIKKLKRTAKSLSGLQEEHKRQTSNLEAAKKAQQEAEAAAHRRYIVLSVIAYGALFIGILLIAVFVFLATRTTRNGARDAKSLTANAESLHCPRCGWEHRPEDTVCKNCKTHF